MIRSRWSVKEVLGLSLCLLAACGLASARADAALTITSPANGSSVDEPLPSIAGETDEVLLPVEVSLERNGKLVEVPPPAQPSPHDLTGATWSTQTAVPLKAGTYTVKARQGLEDEVQSRFSVRAPEVTLDSPASPSGSMTPTYSGHAGDGTGDEPVVTLAIYSGEVASGAPAQILRVPTEGSTWSAGPAPELPEGTYTAIAEQADLAGNKGLSESHTYVLAPPNVPPKASMTWIPAGPAVGESVSLISTSVGGSSPIVSTAWDLTGAGPFGPGPSVITTRFTTVGLHPVRLRVSDSRGATSIDAETIRVGRVRLTLMSPFPVIRIAGGTTRKGARIRLLSVLAPPGALATVRCRGRGCGAKRSQSRVVTASARTRSSGMGLVRFKRFERTLPAGVRLEVVVSRANEIGRFVTFTIRRGHLPSRSDKCVAPEELTRRIPCPPQ